MTQRHTRGQVLLVGGIGPEKKHGRFRESPLEMGVADLRAPSPVALPSRLLRALDEAARRAVEPASVTAGL